MYKMIAVYMNGKTIELEVNAQTDVEAKEKMKDLCPRAESYEIGESNV